MRQPLSIRRGARTVASAIASDASVSFFLGAGVSKAAPSFLPGWPQFREAFLSALISKLATHKLLSRPEAESIYAALSSFTTQQPFSQATEVVLQWIHSHAASAVKNMLQVFAQGNPNLNHGTLAYFAARPNVLVATCNFDTHIEAALRQLRIPHHLYAGHRAIGSLGSFREYVRHLHHPTRTVAPILKIHGCVSTFPTIRATIEQVSRPMRSAAKLALKGLIDRRTLVVAGYRGADTDLVPQILSAARDAEHVYWLALDEDDIIPQVKLMLNATPVVGDLDVFFRHLATMFKSPFRPHQSASLSLEAWADKAVSRTSVGGAALGVMTLAMHVGCFRVVEILAGRVAERLSLQPETVAKALMAMGDTMRRRDPRGALAEFQRAERVARRLRAAKPLLYARTLAYLGGQMLLMGDLDTALRFNTRSIRWAQRDKRRGPRLMALNLDDRAVIFRRRGNVSHAIRLRWKAIRRLEKVGDQINLAMVYNNLGKDYDARDQVQEAAKWWRKSIELKEATGNNPDIARTRFNLGEALRNNGDVQEAVRELVVARDRARITDDKVTEARTIYALAASAYQIRKMHQARRILARARERASKAVDWRSDRSRVDWARRIEQMINGTAPLNDNAS